MILTEANYHSDEARAAYLSASAIKQAKRCEYSWANPEPSDPNKPAFVAGHLFELLATNDEENLEMLYARHPEMVSSRGATKGLLKAEYQAVVDCATAVRKHDFIRDILDKANKQLILTGTICDMPVRMMCDLTYDDWIVDLKTCKNFDLMWDSELETRVEWWQYWHYPMQLYIYKEIAHQNGLEINNVGLIGVSKADSDIQCIQFSDEIIAQAKADTIYTINRMQQIKAGLAEPIRCEHCPACINSKIITGFDMI